MYSPIRLRGTPKRALRDFWCWRNWRRLLPCAGNVRRTGITPRPDRSRQVFRAECTSTFALANFASRASERNPHPRGSKPWSRTFRLWFPRLRPRPLHPRASISAGRRRRLAVSLVSRLWEFGGRAGLAADAVFHGESDRALCAKVHTPVGALPVFAPCEPRPFARAPLRVAARCRHRRHRAASDCCREGEGLRTGVMLTPRRP